MTIDTPSTFTEVFKRNFKVLLSGIHTGLPGAIEVYEGARMCSVKPQIQKKLANGTYLELPVIEEVPLIFPGGSEFGMTWPLKKGDPVWIIFSERSIEEWLANGKEAQPEDLRRFSLTDAVAIPGLFNNGVELPASNNDDVQIIYKEAKIIIKKDGTIELNGNDKSFVTYAALDAAMQAMKTSIEASTVGSINAGILAHVHTTVAVGSPTTPGVGTIASATPAVTVDISASETTTVKTGG